MLCLLIGCRTNPQPSCVHLLPEKSLVQERLTLQELIAPKNVKFYAQDWTFIGNKSPELLSGLSVITGVDIGVLSGTTVPGDLSVSTRMKWASERQTKRPEDIAYCLMGLFGVNMPLLYGEGPRAFIRLQEEISRQTDDQSLFAWKFSTPIENRTELCGMLAQSPMQFRDTPNLRPLPPVLTSLSVPWSITNQGLCVQLYLNPINNDGRDSVEEEFWALLDCSTRTESHELYPTICLRRLWGNQFARILPDLLELSPPPRDNRRYSNEEGYQVLYVKQKPTHLIPQITLARLENSLLLNNESRYQVIEVFPPDRWDRDSLSLKSDYSQMDRVMGVFRFESTAYGKSIDVAVGFRRISQNRWESWCAQRLCKGLLVETVFASFVEDLMAVADDRKMSTLLLGDILGENDRLASTVRTNEFQMRGRTYVSLEVSLKAEVDSQEVRYPHSNPRIASPLILHAKDREIMRELQADIRHLTMACAISDRAAFSILFTMKSMSRVRVVANSPPLERKSPIDEVRDQAASLNVKDIKTRHLPVSYKTAELLHACEVGDLEEVRRLETHFEAEAENFYNFRPLHFATLGGHVDVVQYLLKYGARPDSVVAQGWTALHLAVMNGDVEIVGSLLHALHKLNTVNSVKNDDDAVLNVARMKGRLTEETILHMATPYLTGHQLDDILTSLRNYTKELLFTMVPNYLGETPLHRAAANNTAQAYLDWPGNKYRKIWIDVPDGFSRSPLWHAACAGANLSITALHIRGASLSDDHGRRPLHAACREGHADTVALLIMLGANPDAPTHPPNLTPAHYAALFGHPQCLRELARYGADLERGTYFNSSSSDNTIFFRPMHLAAANGHVECVQVLAPTVQLDSPSSGYLVVDEDGLRARLVVRQTESEREIAEIQGHAHVVAYLGNQRQRMEQRR
jgi:ankyrin repeat protein